MRLSKRIAYNNNRQYNIYYIDDLTNGKGAFFTTFKECIAFINYNKIEANIYLIRKCNQSSDYIGGKSHEHGWIFEGVYRRQYDKFILSCKKDMASNVIITTIIDILLCFGIYRMISLSYERYINLSGIHDNIIGAIMQTQIEIGVFMSIIFVILICVGIVNVKDNIRFTMKKIK